MYYYILETQTDRKSRFIERLTDQLTDTGIAGEMVIGSALKTTDELLRIGLQKGYSTIVGVGSDRHIHALIASLLAYPREERPVLGVIPTDRDSVIARLIKAPTLLDQLQALKVRHLAYATVAEIERSRYLLSQATIQPPRPITIVAEIDGAKITTVARAITVTGDGQIEIESQPTRRHPLVRALVWLVGVSYPEQTTSVFHGADILLHTEIPLPIVGFGETLGHTPVRIRTLRRALKLIVARATLPTIRDSASKGE